ncbi:MAG TPA: hypothetical protein EYO83_04110 [Gemmatimonadetes bacterium]|nr:hypothetical protein [Gemmatimonadota bacterium]
MKKPLNEIVSSNISRLLEERGETTASARKKAGMDQKTVWNMANASHCNPTIKNIEKLASALSVHPSLLLIDSALANGVPAQDTVALLERIARLSPTAQRQVSEFIDMWERPKEGQ